MLSHSVTGTELLSVCFVHAEPLILFRQLCSHLPLFFQSVSSTLSLSLALSFLSTLFLYSVSLPSLWTCFFHFVPLLSNSFLLF